MKQLRWCLNLVVIASLFLLISCGGVGSQQGEGGKSQTSSSYTQEKEKPTAYHMPLLDTRGEEGKNPELKKDTKMYVEVDSEHEGTPFSARVKGKKDYWFKGRTPYYIDLKERNEFGNVGSGSVLVFNGNTDGATLRLVLRTYSGKTYSESCSDYKCDAIVTWEGSQ